MKKDLLLLLLSFIWSKHGSKLEETYMPLEGLKDKKHAKGKGGVHDSCCA